MWPPTRHVTQKARIQSQLEQGLTIADVMKPKMGLSPDSEDVCAPERQEKGEA